MPTRHELQAVLLIVLALVAITPAAVAPALAQRSTSSSPSSALVLRGHVEAVEGWLVHTSIPVAGAPGAALEDGDGLQLELGGHRFFARFVSPERYAMLAGNPNARAALDVDIVCTGDGYGTLVIAPLSGDLQDLVALDATTSVVVVRP